MTLQAATYADTPAPPLGLYIHLPWCVRKCPYCDFNSHAQRGALPVDDYVDALLRDLRMAATAVPGRRIESVFIGGGTPSLFPAEAVGRVLAGAADLVGLTADAEITLEANPGTLERARFAGYREHGVNRLSIGVQSFDNDALAALGRIHDAAAAEQAVDAARAAGFEALNLDLMYALPDQDVTGALADLRRAIALRPGHISHYQLTLEPGTAFFARPPALPDPDLAYTMQHECQALLAEHGYRHYEVSAYAAEGRRCRHNLNYWRFGDYLGIGAGAHAKVTDAATGRVHREERVRHPNAFMQRAGTEAALAGRRAVDAGELPLEFMMNALRLNEPIEHRLWEQRTGEPWDTVGPMVAAAADQGLLTDDGTRIAKTARGALFLDDLLALFLPDHA
ncbi:radical SAM family heme chaperone HemW [Ectothiorhodospiraceae bacterium WFHF3C12]|nr:radical SAM family heme chaperone HemW [Ectothiorhodospiraceae bacterium WFHF3C12]